MARDVTPQSDGVSLVPFVARAAVVGAVVVVLALVFVTGCASGTAPADSNLAVGSAGISVSTSSAGPSGPSIAHLPGKTAGSIDQLVPAAVKSVQIVLDSAPGTAGANQVVTGVAAQRLAAVVTQQSPVPAGNVACGADTGLRDELTFVTTSSVIRVIVKPDPCGSVTVGRTRLGGAATIVEAARAALRHPH